MTTIPDHYAALGIDPTADPEVITAAYRALAKKFHPDTGAAAGTASLLLNLEAIATALLAWFAFNENFDRRIALGMFAIVAGAVLLSWPGALSFDGIAGPALIAAACLAWGIDNNLTRKVALRDPVQIAMWKGVIDKEGLKLDVN